MKEIKNYLVNNDCYKVGKKMSGVLGVLIHSTATPGATPETFVKSWNKPGKEVCVHAFCDDSKVINTLPYNVRAWGCGGTGNDKYIQIEMCEPSEVYFTNGWKYNTKDSAKTKKYVDNMVNVAVEWSVNRLLELGIKEINAITVTSHYEAHERGLASNHGDPKGLLSLAGLTMNDFRARCKKIMDSKLGKDNVEVKPEVKPEKKQLYRVRKSWNDASSQIGAYENLDNAKKNCKTGYTVYDSNGRKVYSNIVEQAKPVQVQELRKGSKVKFKSNAVQYNGNRIPNNYIDKEYVITQLTGTRAVLSINNVVMYAVDVKYLQASGGVVETTKQNDIFKVKVSASALNYRTGPGVGYSIKGTVHKGEVYTIVEEKNGWGKLKSGAGWINLSYTSRI